MGGERRGVYMLGGSTGSVDASVGARAVQSADVAPLFCYSLIRDVGLSLR